MATKKKIQASDGKIWKENPPGAEQKELNRLFENNLISADELPNNVRMQHKIFMDFPARVFGAHFRKTKAKYGCKFFYELFVCLFYYVQNNIFFYLVLLEDETIPELGESSNVSTEKRVRSNAIIEIDEDLNFKSMSYPYRCWSFTDHEQQCDLIFVCVPLVSGCRDVDFSISEDGLKVKINYGWPTAVFNPKELFSDDIKRNVNTDHPKIHYLSSNLLADGITTKSNPTGHFIVNLPMRVQREGGTWKKTAIKKEDGTRIALIELKGFQPEKIIEDEDTSFRFD